MRQSLIEHLGREYEGFVHRILKVDAEEFVDCLVEWLRQNALSIETALDGEWYYERIFNSVADLLSEGEA